MNRQTISSHSSTVSTSTDFAEASNHDKAGKSYWDQTYRPEYAPRAVDPHNTSLKNFVERQFHRYFLKTLRSMEGKELLEVGCGGSRYLPYFSKEFGLRVSGLDYSERGCASASRILTKEGVSGEIVCANFFEPPEFLFERFDVVVSFGVVEHFDDTTNCLAAIARFVKQGGLVLTFIPNMVGLVGHLQRVADRRVFYKHVLLDKVILREAHEQAGLFVQECEYFMFNNFFVINMNEIARHSAEWYLKAPLIRGLKYVSGAIWAVETLFHPFRPNRFMAPFIACAARVIEPKSSVSQGWDLRDDFRYGSNPDAGELGSGKEK